MFHIVVIIFIFRFNVSLAANCDFHLRDVSKM